MTPKGTIEDSKATLYVAILSSQCQFRQWLHVIRVVGTSYVRPRSKKSQLRQNLHVIRGGSHVWNRDDLGYDSEPERTLLRRRREARRRERQAALEQHLSMAAEHNDDNLNLENN
ncbi:hypothetical protein PIB30_074403 [Stylosanthes scabra]|uniref:Uncharacterized protein n=1 Tax=Stylosanthes scabra TaxID=79078 RepID=A0ABU6QQ19_9FABA|nr:hypothetical protein [Stylosanthes scabra]